MRASFDELPFISCDWGTSSFRLRWVVNGSVRRALKTDVGCRQLFNESGGDPARRRNLFELHLAETLALLENELSGYAPVPIVISGMASSSIGWVELPYASLPLDLSGQTLNVHPLLWRKPDFIGPTLLVSGAASTNDMMRGEETEAIGILSQMQDRLPDAILILPGTHSKHLRISGNKIIDIQTCMTGELFELLSTHSVLRASLEPVETLDLDHFAHGVETAVERGLPTALFQTRTRQVLHAKPKDANAAFLSGILIGSEIASLKGSDIQVLLAATDPLRALYVRALQAIGIRQFHAFTPEDVVSAVPRAHAMILDQHLNR